MDTVTDLIEKLQEMSPDLQVKISVGSQWINITSVQIEMYRSEFDSDFDFPVVIIE